MSGAAARLAAALAVLSLAACSATRLAYDNAETYLHWQAGRYLELDGEQDRALNTRIAAFMAWHRAQALPEYARLADEAGRRFADGLSREDLVWGYDSLRMQARESLRAAAGEIAVLLDRLTPEQIVLLENRLQDDNYKFAEEHMRGTPEERRKRRLRRNLERLEDWLGTLGDAQIGRVRQYAERVPLDDELRDRERKRLQGELLAMLRAREASRRLPDWAAHWDRDRELAYAAAIRIRLAAYVDMLIDLDASLSPGQRRRAAARLRGYAGDFRLLAGRRAVQSTSR